MAKEQIIPGLLAYKQQFIPGVMGSSRFNTCGVTVPYEMAKERAAKEQQ